MSRTSDRTYLKNRKRIRHLDTCWLCGHHISDDYQAPHPLSWSADHVDPVARSGNNHGELMPAHRICNQKRKTKPPPVRHARQW